MWIKENEYVRIKKQLPILCVDTVVVNKNKEILFVRRKNEPLKNFWWIPGGRVNLGESRNDAAVRKLKEECGITASPVVEWKTFDFFIPDTEENYISHTTSTFYIFFIDIVNVSLDTQSSDFVWKKIDNLHDLTLEHPYRYIFDELVLLLKTI
jgi:colanic acid biosynthesis protein WcaH